MSMRSSARVEALQVMAWQDRAWALSLALAGSLLLSGAVFGVRPLITLSAAGLAVLAGAAISIKASLDRLDDVARRQRMRSLAIALVLAALVVIFYTATIVRLGGNVLNRPI